MSIRKNIDHLLIGVGFAILGTLLGILIVEIYWLTKGYKLGTAWNLLNSDLMLTNMLILSQVPNVFLFGLFYQTKRDRSAYGVMSFIILVGGTYAIYSWL